MDEKIQAAIDTLNIQLTNQPYRLAIVDPVQISLADKNARYMNEPTFHQLVDNIKKDGGLTSVPLCVREASGYKVLSGNHRIKAAEAAGIHEVLILWIDKRTRGEEVARQLSHNAIVGQDDMIILKALWSEIDDLDMKLYAGLDSDTLGDLEKISFTSIAPINIEYKQITLHFFPEEPAGIVKLLEDMEILFHADLNFISSVQHYRKTFSLITEVKSRFNIVNNPTAFLKIVELARAQIEYLKKEPEPSSDPS